MPDSGGRRWEVRRLGPQDVSVVHCLAQRDGEFDVEGRSGPKAPLAPEDARALLSDAGVLFWVAFDEDATVGFLLCHVLRLRTQPGRELLLYEIGVRADRRRQGVGTCLVLAMKRWMRAERINEVWVLADNPGAVAFYRSAGLAESGEFVVYMFGDNAGRDTGNEG